MIKKFKIKYINKIINYNQFNKFYYKTSNNLPIIEKITLNFNQKSIDFKRVVSAHLALELLFARQNIVTEIRKSNVFYKTKKGQPTGCKLIINNKIENLNVCKIIYNILSNNENSFNYKTVLNNDNTFTISILEIYNFKDLENYYLLFNKLKTLNIYFKILVKNKISNETNYFLKNAQIFFAYVTQLVECNLAKIKAKGSNPFICTRAIF